MTVNKTTSDCTIYAFVGTAILAISLVVAMYVGNDFHQSLFVESIIFVGSNILLWAIFISMVNYPYELIVWNIAERLGKRDYTMAMRIAFIKALFPKPFEGLDYSTLKNLKAPCSNDVIPIDEPDNGGHDFHDVTEKTSE